MGAKVSYEVFRKKFYRVAKVKTSI